MTISSETRKAGPYSGNGVTVTFPFAFKVFSQGDVVVIRTESTGAETTLALTTDYLVSLNADQDISPGGSVSLPVALVTGHILTLTSAVAAMQPLDLTNQGGFYPKTINAALDRLTILVQQLAEKLSRALKYSISSSLGDGALPAPVANNVIGWNSEANGFQNYAPVDNTLIAASLGATSGSALIGFTQSGAGAVSRTVQDELRGSISVKQFGAGAGGDDTAAFQNAINAAGTNGTINIPRGVYYLSATLTCPPNFTIKGEGANSTLLRRSADYGDTFQFGNATTACAHVRIYDLWMMHGSANYTKGTNSLPDLATQGAHLRVFGSQEAIISNVWLWRLPYQIVFEGGSLGVIDKCHFYGIWDNDYPAAQEGISQVTYRTAPALGIVTSMKIRDSFFTGDAAFARNVTFSTSTGNVIKSITDCVGSQYGVDIACSEDFDMTGCYLSAHSRNSVLIDPSGGDPAFEIRFANNFFDVAKSQSILIAPTSTNASYVNINGNTFNGEGTGIHAINILSTAGTFGSHSTSITNNNFLAHIGTPILAAGLYAGVISGNTFASYNILNVHASDPSYCSAIYCTDKTGNVAVNGNVIGYGTYCYKGIVIEPGLVNVSQFNNINSGAVSFAAQALPVVTVNPGSDGIIGMVKGVNFNTTADQAIPITFPPNCTKYTLRSVYITNTTVPLTSAIGGVYPATGKGGVAYVPATQVYTSAGTGPTAMIYLSMSNTGAYQYHVDPVLYLSLSTPQGASATGDVFVFGTFLP